MEDRYLSKAKKISDGEWVQGNLIQSCDATDGWESIIIPVKNSNMFTKHIGHGYGNLGFENWYRVDPSTICQCTGLKDKNDKLIWEHDIANIQCEKAIVVRDKVEWRIKWIKDTIWRKDLHFWTNEDDWKCEVIGNIFDNPELLESEE